MIWQVAVRRESELVQKQDRIERVLNQFCREIPRPRRDLPQDISEILLYLREHLFDLDLNVSTLRHRCSLRNNNVSARFRCAVGLGLRDYIEAGRVEAAKRLLPQDDLEIYLISMAVGYEHQETFCRAFQRQVGCAPSEWRETHVGSWP